MPIRQTAAAADRAHVVHRPLSIPIDDIFATESIELDGPFRAVLQYPRQCRRLNRTIKETTVKRYHYDSHAQLTAHLHDFVNAYNYGRRLKTLRGLTPYEYICKC